MNETEKHRRVEAQREHVGMSRASIAALALYILLTAGLLTYVNRYVPEHPAVVYLEILGFPVLVLLAFILAKLGKRRRLRS